MKKREIPDKIIYWYKDFLDNRTSGVNLKGPGINPQSNPVEIDI